MKNYSSREIIKILEKDRWYLIRYLIRIVGSHHHFLHPILKWIAIDTRKKYRFLPMGFLKFLAINMDRKRRPSFPSNLRKVFRNYFNL